MGLEGGKRVRRRRSEKWSRGKRKKKSRERGEIKIVSRLSGFGERVKNMNARGSGVLNRII